MNFTFKAEMPKIPGIADFSVEVKANDNVLHDLLPVITQFLRGAGYHFDGELVIEAPEAPSAEDSNE